MHTNLSKGRHQRVNNPLPLFKNDVALFSICRTRQILNAMTLCKAEPRRYQSSKLEAARRLLEIPNTPFKGYFISIPTSQVKRML